MLPDKIVYLTKRSNNILQLQTTISFTKKYIEFELYSNLFNASHVPLVFEEHNSIEALIISSLFRSNYTKMPLFSSKLDHTIYPDLLLVIEAQRYERTSFFYLLYSIGKNFVRGGGQSMKSSVTDVVSSPTVPSVNFITLES